MEAIVKNYYEILGVNLHSDLEEVERAFELLSEIYHPENNPHDPSAQAQYKAIREAYLILTDPELRETYNTTYQELFFQEEPVLTEEIPFSIPNREPSFTPYDFRRERNIYIGLFTALGLAIGFLLFVLLT